jgi:voltage-gated potassium channel
LSKKRSGRVEGGDNREFGAPVRDRRIERDRRSVKSARRNLLLRRALYRILDPQRSGRTPEAFRLAHHGMVVLGVGALVLATVPNISADYRAALDAVFYVALAFFAAEYLCRLYVVPEAPWSHQGRRWRDRLHWSMTLQGLVGLCSTWVVGIAAAFSPDAASVRLACVTWLFKFVPYSEGLSLLGRVIADARSTLVSVLLAFIIVLLSAGTLAYLVERDVQPETFGSVPTALWWAVVTLTTTGYGDAVPVTLAGRLLGGCVMICGIALFALWAGILANGFAEELKRRDLQRTWDLVTKVPLFNAVGAETISEVTRLLRPRDVPEGAVVVRRGEPGDCMYFVVSGEIEIRIPPKPVRLGAGAFFGEIALITGEPRTATVVASRSSVMLVLHVTDFRHLAARRPELMAAIAEESSRRVAHNNAADDPSG